MSAGRKQKNDLIAELISEFRVAGNQDSAFDNLAAERLGLNRTDLHCDQHHREQRRADRGGAGRRRRA